jgi:hypothetical protein
MEKVDKEVVVLLMAHVPRFETDSLKVQQATGWQPRRNTETFLREIDKLGIAITRHNCIQFNSDYPKDALTDVFLAIHKTEDKLHINRNFHHQHLFQ